MLSKLVHGEMNGRFYINIKMRYYLEQITNDIFCVFESSNEVFRVDLKLVGYEVYCEAQAFFLFIEGLTKRRATSLVKM